MLVCPQRSAVRYQGRLLAVSAAVTMLPATASSTKLRLVTRRFHLQSVHTKERCSWCGGVSKAYRTFCDGRGFGCPAGGARGSRARDYRRGGGQNPIALAN